MDPESLAVLVRGRMLDEAPVEEQRALLQALYGAHGPIAGEPLTAPDAVFADSRYSAGELPPKTYCYLAYCSKILEISTMHGRHDTMRLWGYVMWSTLDTDAQAEFGRALDADLAGRRRVGGDDTEPPGPTVTETPTLCPLKDTVSSMIRAMVFDRDFDRLRELVRWSYSNYEPHLKTLLDESDDDDSWMINLAELLPRLLLRNCIALHDSVAIRDPKVVMAMYTSSRSPAAFYDPGVLVRRSTLVRTLFDEKEIHALEQAGQRIAELFAHAYPLLLLRDPQREAADVRNRVRRIAQERGRIPALQHIEIQHRHSLRIPTWLYREMKGELRASA